MALVDSHAPFDASFLMYPQIIMDTLDTLLGAGDCGHNLAPT